ncbi:glycoside hydrolase family 55 protein [Aspergillus homomorphus CBS 101889]|uniref:Pectin lyase-like protein n=1 Tax=Aspergillus homomorphus (strain CBS 101889) TaxID=1450537 RepID=A0A395ICE3_ASPHC|nr:pectin lyase-like protein [Aspergillus homomorphus CBS 101889]RAL15844.1 pectin lyase-like protein [Aspergillus homomorphus CBS 101889]
MCAHSHSGIPFVIQNRTAQPWVSLNGPAVHETLASTSTSLCSSSSSNSGRYWYEEIEHNGESSFLDSGHKESYKVFRNVVEDYGADNTGRKDASAAIQAAIQAGPSNGPDRASHSMGTTGQPAIVYLPGGTYLLQSSLQFFVGTVLIGDPTNPPVLKAAANFPDDHIIYAKDPNFGGTINFYIGMKNVVLDSTAVGYDKNIALLDWTVSQATQLTNVGFNMPTGTATHVGLTTQYDYNSNLIMNDLWFKGGAVGMKLNGQQWVFKNLSFVGTTTGVIAGGTDITFMGCHFEQCQTGIDAHGTSGSLTVIDTSAISVGTFITSGTSNTAGNSIVLENISNYGNTVKIGNTIVLSGGVSDTWVHGHLYTAGSNQMQSTNGQLVTTVRASPLLSGNKYFTKAPPTYQEYSASQVLNIKNVPDKPVYGDGDTDDTHNINAILSSNKDCKVIYFPAGTYIVTDTILIPSGSRIIGDSFASMISAVGSNFESEASPRAMIQVGYPGDVGVAQISDLVFTVADILPGCQLVEVNIAGKNAGDVGFWNAHFRIGGAVGSQVETQCSGRAEDCKAAYGLIHLSSTSSAYIENMWGWTADHDLDGDNAQTISTGRGMLVEATAATWLIGTGMEHNTLYQYNFEYARNVFSALQQSESPYWQGVGNTLAPAPWHEHLISSDPDFSGCDPDDAICRMALFERIRGSSDLFLYGGCNWVFFNDNGDCKAGDCQKNAIQIESSSSIYLYGTNTKSTTNMVLEGNVPVARQSENAGGWGGVIAAYLYDS